MASNFASTCRTAFAIAPVSWQSFARRLPLAACFCVPALVVAAALTLAGWLETAGMVIEESPERKENRVLRPVYRKIFQTLKKYLFSGNEFP